MIASRLRSCNSRCVDDENSDVLAFRKRTSIGELSKNVMSAESFLHGKLAERTMKTSDLKVFDNEMHKKRMHFIRKLQVVDQAVIQAKEELDSAKDELRERLSKDRALYFLELQRE